MREVTQYQAEDGTTFETRDACELHERTPAFLEYARTHPLVLPDPEHLAGWLVANVEAVRGLVAPGVRGLDSSEQVVRATKWEHHNAMRPQHMLDAAS